MNKQTVKDRMLLFLAEVDISQGKFEKKVELSNGFVNNIGDSIRYASLEKIAKQYPELNTAWLLTGEGNMLIDGSYASRTAIKPIAEDQNQDDTYQAKRHKLKSNKQETLMYYQIGANAGTQHSAEILPVNKNEGVLHISDLFKGSQFAIRISGNSMTPSYPSGAIIGIREVHDKQITPGSVYVIEKDNDLWIKRLFYKDDNQHSGLFECVSDNEMRYEKGPREGRLYYPPFDIEVDKVRRLFKVTGIYKSNDLSVIN